MRYSLLLCELFQEAQSGLFILVFIQESCVPKEYSIQSEERKVDEEDVEEVENDPSDLLGTLIPKNQLHSIKNSGLDLLIASQYVDSIKELLNEPFIQKAIISIMSSDNKERALNNMKNNSEFSLLIDELLLCVGVAKRREDGSLEFTGL